MGPFRQHRCKNPPNFNRTTPGDRDTQLGLSFDTVCQGELWESGDTKGKIWFSSVPLKVVGIGLGGELNLVIPGHYEKTKPSGRETRLSCALKHTGLSFSG